MVGYVSLNEHCKHCVLTKCCSCSYLTLVEAISERRSAKEREVDKLRSHLSAPIPSTVFFFFGTSTSLLVSTNRENIVD